MPWPRLTARLDPGNWRRLEAKSVTGEDNRANANARLIHATAPGRALSLRGGCPHKVPPVPLFSVIVREHAYTGQFYHDVVEAGSCEQALQLAAGQASGLRAAAGSGPQPDDADPRRCADVWVHSLLRCELEEGHDPPHMTAAPGYRCPARWVRDDRGLAHALPEPGTGPGTRI